MNTVYPDSEVWACFYLLPTSQRQRENPSDKIGSMEDKQDYSKVCYFVNLFFFFVMLLILCKV